MLRYLLDMGVSLELDSDGNRASPLHYTRNFAPLREKKKFARMLIDAGIPVDIKNHNGLTPLEFALQLRDHWLAKVLIDAGAAIDDERRFRFQPWVLRFVTSRKNARASSIAVLGLLRCRSAVMCNNGRDILYQIARCVWESRGHKRVWRNK